MHDKISAEIRVTKDGPYLVSGELPLAKAMIGSKEERESIDWQWTSHSRRRRISLYAVAATVRISRFATAPTPRSGSMVARGQGSA